MMKHKHAALYMSAAFLAVMSFAAAAVPESGKKIDVACIQSPDHRTLDCTYRAGSPESILGVSAYAGDTYLPVRENVTYPWPDAVTAILFVVDTSDPGRQNVIEKNQAHIEALFGKIAAHHRIGLASFDKVLRVEAPLGSTPTQVLEATRTLRAIGMTTELYRSVMTAVELLDKTQADRKAIFLFSDGLAEDKAYFHQDVVAAARKAGVIITSFGYQRSIAQSVALQTLRRLSEETGGLFVDTGSDYSLPAGILDAPYDRIESGGRLSVDISLVIVPEANEKIAVNLNFSLESGEDRVNFTVTNPEAAAPVAEPPVIQPTAPPVATPVREPPPIRVITTPAPAKPVDTWIWVGIPIALVIVLLITIASFFLLLRRQEKKPEAPAAFSDFKPYAYLILQDETKKRYPITRTSWRIGRSRDNELTLVDNSVSRRHAEIHRDKGDVFTIIDLDSLNGVYVNNNKIHRHRLHEGDIIEIGDISLRFTLLPVEYSVEESTVMQNTKVPVTH